MDATDLLNAVRHSIPVSFEMYHDKAKLLAQNETDTGKELLNLLMASHDKLPTDLFIAFYLEGKSRYPADFNKSPHVRLGTDSTLHVNSLTDLTLVKKIQQYLSFIDELDKPLESATTQVTSKLDMVPLFKNEDMLKIITPLIGSSRDEVISQYHTKKLKELSRLSPLKEKSICSDVFSIIAKLRIQFPNFAEVLDYFMFEFAIAGSGGNPIIKFSPVLLRGNPGIGKTEFVYTFTRMLQVSLLDLNFGACSDGMILNGMDPTWQGAKPGLIVDHLLHNKEINPVVYLDELDKATQTIAKRNPFSTLLSLLEHTTAKSFKDEFYKIPMNCSEINWIATANHLELPEEIENRFVVFEVPDPTLEQKRQIIHFIWKGLHEKVFPTNTEISEQLSDDVIDKLLEVSPRAIGQQLRTAAGRAVLRGNSEVSPDDVVLGKKTSQKIGFY